MKFQQTLILINIINTLLNYFSHAYDQNWTILTLMLLNLKVIFEQTILISKNEQYLHSCYKVY